MKEETAIKIARIVAGTYIISLSLIFNTNHLLWFIGGVLCGVPFEILRKIRHE